MTLRKATRAVLAVITDPLMSIDALHTSYAFKTMSRRSSMLAVFSGYRP